MSEILRKFNIAPVSASRPRVTRKGTFYSKPYNDFKNYFPFLLGTKKRLSGALSVTLLLTIPMPKPWAKKKKAEMYSKYHTQTPDADNYAKAILDCFNGHFYDDDSQVAVLTVVKKWGVSGMIVAKIKELEEKEDERQMKIYDLDGVK